MANLPDSDAIRADFERARDQVNQRVTDALARVAAPGAGLDDLVIAAMYEGRESARRETKRFSGALDAEQELTERLRNDLTAHQLETHRLTSQIVEQAAQAARLQKDLEEARKALWQPIKTAPRDGIHILGYVPHGQYHVLMHWVSVAWKADGSLFLDDEDVTHWQPLPQPPAWAAGEISSEGEAG